MVNFKFTDTFIQVIPRGNQAQLSTKLQVHDSFIPYQYSHFFSIFSGMKYCKIAEQLWHQKHILNLFKHISLSILRRSLTTQMLFRKMPNLDVWEDSEYASGQIEYVSQYASGQLYSD